MLQAGPRGNNRYSLTVLKILTGNVGQRKLELWHIVCSASVVTTTTQQSATLIRSATH